MFERAPADGASGLSERLGHAADLLGSICVTKGACECWRTAAPLGHVVDPRDDASRNRECDYNVRKKLKVAKITIRLQDELAAGRFPTRPPRLFSRYPEFALKFHFGEPCEGLRALSK